MNPNVLRQWMQLYDREMAAPTNADAGGGMMVPVRGAQDFNRAGRMMFAERMAGGGESGGPPDFFGERPFNALAQYREPAGPMGPPAMPQRPQRTNVLRRSY